MKRLTQRDEYGNADIIEYPDMLPKVCAELSAEESNALTGAMNRLAYYEDNGMELEQPKG
ncbi:hypothetical protein [Bacteroides acidifaciens]|uniref:hypothetical protein n=1 Tax=Bacteroides acidifaciens TaxID=85831 RepID=UPI00248D2E37|nr:hypothetical protein [Bacteroides acidifaciens]